ncbi:leucine-rich repeat protein (LRRP), putative [Trypanosoma brucei gambiense DAL972]|uniref:Leucine-rich repeat protein (LRRP), putative n=1 Tax=Trypanosoma brucei gambiense (strain MHOM/CI/86/DAL972) TaxID=679716 RepID=C9ZXN7_TRYB9|nr:leucine-rich repeat protein (LRRP), putative [Trypanosoma brucei gambiense DAL972]CBH14182.1 leucine-rich repeat protein (LRRP), putative [Trypanosoma brucei gambiense DAL972]|eukprot:XP_011776452.1 leucine-rich repeat protein (LRRP), putative [Trypanosoma brucei gambiense DAL972]
MLEGSDASVGGDVRPCCGETNRLRVGSLRATGSDELRSCHHLILTEKVERESLRFLRLCTSIQTLRFEGEYPFADLSPIPELRSLGELSIEEAPKLENFVGIKNLPQLKALEVAEAPIRGGCLQTLTAGCNLVKLCLDSCPYLKDVSPLAEMTALEHLAICKCVGIETGIGSLGKLPALRELYLIGTSMRGNSLRGLGATTSLLNLCIVSCGCLTDVLHIADVQVLRQLTLESCTSLEEGVGKLGGLPALYELDLSYSSIVDVFLQGLSSSRSLVKLNLSWCDQLTDVSPLAELKTLKYLNLQSCEAVVAGIGDLGKLPGLYELDLSCTPITDCALRDLCSSRSLVRLDISSCDNLTDLSALVSLKTLGELNLDACTEVKQGIGNISQLPELRRLDGTCLPITDDSLRDLSASRSLVVLCLDTCMDITDVSCLAAVKTLEEISLNSCLSVEKGVEALTTLPRLRSVNLRGVKIDSEVLSELQARGVNLLR